MITIRHRADGCRQERWARDAGARRRIAAALGSLLVLLLLWHGIYVRALRPAAEAGSDSAQADF